MYAWPIVIGMSNRLLEDSVIGIPGYTRGIWATEDECVRVFIVVSALIENIDSLLVFLGFLLLFVRKHTKNWQNAHPFADNWQDLWTWPQQYRAQLNTLQNFIKHNRYVSLYLIRFGSCLYQDPDVCIYPWPIAIAPPGAPRGLCHQNHRVYKWYKSHRGNIWEGYIGVAALIENIYSLLVFLCFLCLFLFKSTLRSNKMPTPLHITDIQNRSFEHKCSCSVCSFVDIYLFAYPHR